MSTRATIAITHKDDTLTSILVLRDAYPDHLGEILTNYYQSPRKIQELMNGGDILDINKNIEKCVYIAQKQSLPMSEWQAKQWRNLSHFMSVCMQEYDYLYIYQSGKWYCHNCNE